MVLWDSQTYYWVSQYEHILKSSVQLVNAHKDLQSLALLTPSQHLARFLSHRNYFPR